MKTKGVGDVLKATKTHITLHREQLLIKSEHELFKPHLKAEKKNCQHRIIYSPKVSFRNE